MFRKLWDKAILNFEALTCLSKIKYCNAEDTRFEHDQMH